MKTMIDTLKTSVLAFVRDEEGTAMIEYGLLGALVSAACATALGQLGAEIDAIFAAVTLILTNSLP